MSLKLEHVTHTYGVGSPFEKTALHHIDLEIKEGDFVGIIGHTGSGKSTLVQLLNGLLQPTAGAVTVDGMDLGKKTKEAMAMRHKVGMVFQYPEYQLFEETIAKDIAFGPRNFGLSEEDVQKRVREAMGFVGLDYDTYANRSPFHLSGGQMRRVAIAGVIAIHPKYLILDEPSAGLDPVGRREIFEEIRQWHAERNMTVILVSIIWMIFLVLPIDLSSCLMEILSSMATLSIYLQRSRMFFMTQVFPFLLLRKYCNI